MTTIEPRELFRSSDPDTSREAAEHITKNGDVSKARLEVLEVLKLNPGTTSRELALCDSEVQHESFHNRLPELERLGAAHRGEPRKCRVTGRRVTTWYPGLKGEPEQMDLI